MSHFACLYGPSSIARTLELATGGEHRWTDAWGRQLALLGEQKLGRAWGRKPALCGALVHGYLNACKPCIRSSFFLSSPALEHGPCSLGALTQTYQANKSKQRPVWDSLCERLFSVYGGRQLATDEQRFAWERSGRAWTMHWTVRGRGSNNWAR